VTTEAIEVRSTGQWIDSSDGQHWWFDSGSLALDFAFTGAMVSAPDAADSPSEQLREPDDLNTWLSERFPGIDARCGERELTDARMLRAGVARLAVATASAEARSGDDIDIVNLFAATPDIPPVLAGGARQAGRTRPTATQALATIARDAVRLFGPDAGGRIRVCSAPDCAYIYLDTSRAGTRRWCSMQRCGNRAKVRAHRARARAPQA
jgi:predicted RNA-binding Zn ribbon-like protein